MTTEIISTRSEKVACLGLGNMGAGIARRVQGAGFPLTVYNRTPSKTEPFVQAGAAAAATPREAAAAADIVITCLMDDASVLKTVSGEDGLLAGLKEDGVHINATTISPEAATTLADLHSKHGSHYVAGPVLGRPDAAEAGRLITFLGGDPAVIERCKPVIETYAPLMRTVSEDHALANVTKLCANYMAVSISDLMGQIYAYADKAGLDLTILRGLFDGAFAAPGLKEYVVRIHERNFSEEKAGFSMIGGLKDVELMIRSASDYGVTLDYAAIIQEKLKEAIGRGMGGCDWCGTYEISRSRAGLD